MKFWYFNFIKIWIFSNFFLYLAGISQHSTYTPKYILKFWSRSERLRILYLSSCPTYLWIYILTGKDLTTTIATKSKHYVLNALQQIPCLLLWGVCGCNLLVRFWVSYIGFFVVLTVHHISNTHLHISTLLLTSA